MATKKTITKSEETKVPQFTVPVFDMTGKEVKTIDLKPEVFGIEPNTKLLAQYIRVYLANQRQGTVSQKTRSEVAGTTKKIYKQKGTGRARHGAKKAPIFVGGGVTHPRKPTDFSLKFNSKQRAKVMLYALSAKLTDKDIIFVEGLNDIKPKTKELATALKSLNLKGVKTMLVAPTNKNVSFAYRNIEKVEFTIANTLNPYQILGTKKLLIDVSALEALYTRTLKA